MQSSSPVKALEYRRQKKKGQESYQKILQRCGIEETKKKKKKILSVTGFKHVRLLHDNAPAHTSAIVTFFFFFAKKRR